MTITTAVIFAAGVGTRMLPITAAVEKELLPILNRPAIDYVVADCVAAGITRIIFVVRPGSHALRDYYLGNPDLERALRRHHKTAALDQLDAVHRQATFEFIDQPEDGRYGTAIPLLTAAPHLPSDEAFLTYGGEDFIWHADGTSDTANLIRSFQGDTRAIGAMAAHTQPTEQLHRYGILDLKQQEGRTYLRNIVEKPSPGAAPSHLANLSKYLFAPDFLDYLGSVQPHPQTSEYYLTDAVAAAALDRPFVVYQTTGEYLDAGNVAGWLRANLTLAAADPELSPIVSDPKFKK